MFLSSFLGSIFVLFPLLLLFLINHQLWRRWTDYIVGYWLVLPVAYLELVCGTKIHVQGDLIDKNDKAIIIMNHRTRLDWMFFWNALYYIDPWLLTSEKIILKAMLKNIVGAGWAMQCNAFVFLDRNWEKDEAILKSSCQYLASMERSYQLLMFPEGTDFCERSKQHSDRFSSENNLAQLHYVLQPRTTGLSCLALDLNQYEALNCIYDVTVAYPSEIVQSEFDMVVRGAHPTRVDFLIKKISAAEMPSIDEFSIRDWCRDRWQMKDELLRTYYSQSDTQLRQLSSSLPPVLLTNKRKWHLVLGLLLWTAAIVFWLCLIYTSKLCLMFFIVGVGFFAFVHVFLGGLDQVLLRLHTDFKP